jgi:hypothetical protein
MQRRIADALATEASDRAFPGRVEIVRARNAGARITDAM